MMKVKVEILLLGCIAFSSLEDFASQGQTHFCKQFTEDGVLVANCREQGLVAVPQDLDAKIQKLDLSLNALSDLNENQFKRYSNLKDLKMTSMKAYFSKGYYYVFRQLNQLTTLDLSYGKWVMGGCVDYREPVLYWPPNLKILTMIDACEECVWHLDLSNLEKLERLDVNQNNLQIFPTFNTLAPLKFINLTKTNIIRMRAEDLAPLCQLEELHINLISNAEFFTTEKYCECKRVLAWMEKNNIKGGESTQCKYRNETCDLKFSEELLSIREKCLSRSKMSLGSKILISLIFMVIIIGGGIGGYFGYMYWKKMKMENDS